MKGIAPAAVFRACAATTRAPGTGIVSLACRADGITVQLASATMAQAAEAALRRDGYALNREGPEVMVVGWDAKLLVDRVTGLEGLVEDERHHIRETARRAIDEFLKRRDGEALPEDQARDAAIRTFTEGRPPAGSGTTVDLGDLPDDPEVAERLRKVALLEITYNDLRRIGAGVASDVIGLFLEYRDVHDRDEDSARSAAWLDVNEALQLVGDYPGMDSS